MNQAYSAKTVSEMVCCARATVYRTVYRFEELGEDSLQDQRTFKTATKLTNTHIKTLLNYIDNSPKDYGWLRANWTLELLSLQLEADTKTKFSPSYIGKLLKQNHCKRKRPCPILRKPIKGRRKILEKIRSLIQKASSTEEVFYQDEADIHLNPKLGATYMKKGKQLKVVTPGKNHKHYVAGALNTRTGKVTHDFHERKNSDLFIKFLATLLKSYKKAKVIHLILDNYIIHKSKKVATFLAHGGQKIRLHFLPPYSPQENKIELLWKQMHDNVTRNHKCQTISEVISNVQLFLRNASPFPGKKVSIVRID